LLSSWRGDGRIRVRQRGAAKRVRGSGKRKRSRGRGRREASGVQVVDPSLNRLATRNEVCVVHGEVSVEARAERIVAVAYGYCKGSARGGRDNGSDLPTTCDIFLPARLRSGDIPYDRAGEGLADIEVASTDSGALEEQERHSDGVEVGVASDGSRAGVAALLPKV